MKKLPSYLVTRQLQMSKVYKIRSEEVEDVKETLMKFVVQKKSLMAESDVIHALIKYHLKIDSTLRVYFSNLGARSKYSGK